MFKLANKDTYKRVIKVEVPGDLGKIDRQQFVMEFKRLSVSDTRALVDDSQEGKMDDEELISRYAVSWEGIFDENGEEIPFSLSALSEMMDITYVKKAIMSAFIEDVFGKEATRKN